ncbi:MAG TPA: hypothetical protein VHQ47_13990 [Phycisphaerae bacterium]|nr:hypothetical protein [Phycisphaerae bacterium]
MTTPRLHLTSLVAALLLTLAARAAAPQKVADLPTLKQMPNPLIMNDGTPVKTPDQWRARREEMKKILEDWEYGHMPPPPGNVTAKETDAKDLPAQNLHYRLLHLTFGPDSKLGFDLALFTPLNAKPPFPTILSLSFAANERAAAQYKAAFARGYAVAVVGYQQLGADNKNFRQTAFFPAYPQYDWNDFSAWAWGLSRAVDYLDTDPSVDKNRLIATGTSRLGQAVLLAGAFDERISLVAPVAGGMALRFSGKNRGGGQGIDEVVDQNTYWFGPRFAEFKGQTDKLPCDQHWLLALAAPRPFILLNSLKDQYGNPWAAAQSVLAAKPVYAFLHAQNNLGMNFRPGTHGMTADDWSALLDFADEKLLHKPPTRTFDHLPPNPSAPAANP